MSFYNRIAYNILQKHVICEPNKIRICINPEWINIKQKRNFDNRSNIPLFEHNVVKKDMYLFKNSLVASICDKNTFTEYLFYTPNDGTVINTNDELLKNINNIFENKYSYSDMLDKLWIAELNIENDYKKSNEWFSGYY